MMKISSLHRLRINRDGEGIRTLIVTYGCNLQCRYCINPQTWEGKGSYKVYSPEELYQEIALDSPYFMATSGGVTFGGGEPLRYVDQIVDFKHYCNGDFTIFAETSLYVSDKDVRKAAYCFDKFFVDIKTMDPIIYKEYTGGDLSLALNNLELLLSLVDPDRVEVRIPVIPEYTSEEDQRRYQKELIQFGVIHFDLFTYTNTGISKGEFPYKKRI